MTAGQSCHRTFLPTGLAAASAAGTVGGNPRSKLPGLGCQGKRTRRVCLVFCKTSLRRGAEQDLPELCWGHGARPASGKWTQIAPSFCVRGEVPEQHVRG